MGCNYPAWCTWAFFSPGGEMGRHWGQSALHTIQYWWPSGGLAVGPPRWTWPFLHKGVGGTLRHRRASCNWFLLRPVVRSGVRVVPIARRDRALFKIRTPTPYRCPAQVLFQKVSGQSQNTHTHVLNFSATLMYELTHSDASACVCTCLGLCLGIHVCILGHNMVCVKIDRQTYPTWNIFAFIRLPLCIFAYVWKFWL